MAAGILVFLAGLQLFVFSERTDRYFAWTIDPPLTAAFLGASYWSSVVFEWVAARQRTWADSRVAVPTVFTFTALTLVVTLVHIDRFHLGASFEAATRAVTWGWIAIYASVPVIMAVLWVRQGGVEGVDPPRGLRLPAPLRALAAAQAIGLLVIGLGLLFAPDSFASSWPWTLTALTGRAIGAWLVSLGVAGIHALVENSARRLRPAAMAFIAFPLLQAWALIRYPGDMRWGSLAAGTYLLFLTSTLVVGSWTLALGRNAMSEPAGVGKAKHPG